MKQKMISQEDFETKIQKALLHLEDYMDEKLKICLVKQLYNDYSNQINYKENKYS